MNQKLIKENHSYKIFHPDSFTLQNLKEYLKNIFSESKAKQKYHLEIENDNLYITTELVYKGSEKLKYKEYQFYQTNNTLKVVCKKVKIEEDIIEKYESINSKKDTLIKDVISYINDLLDCNNSFTSKNDFIASLSLEQKNHVLYCCSPQEIVLSCLPITNVKSEVFELYKNNEYYILLTNFRTQIIIVNEQEIVFFDISEYELIYKEKIGKDYIFSDKFSFYTEFWNSNLLASIQHILTKVTSNRIAVFTDVLWNNNIKDAEKILKIKAMYHFGYKQTNMIKTLLKAMLVPAFIKKEFKETVLDECTLFDLIQENINIGTVITEIFIEWKISLEEQLKFLSFLISNKECFRLINITAFYDKLVKTFINDKKNKKDIAFNLRYIDYLKETEQFYKAIPFAEKSLTELQEGSIIEMLSDNKINIIAGENVNLIRVKILEDLVFFKKEINQVYKDELVALAVMQPLLLSRIEALKILDDSPITKKANTIIELFKSLDFFKASEETSKILSKEYSKEYLYDKVFPECFKEKKGFLDSFTKIIAQVDGPDYNEVIKFSEKITNQNYPIVHEVFEKVKRSLSLPDTQCFLGRGDYASSLIGVENTPDFLLIGSDYLTLSSNIYLSKVELQFAMTLELSHVLFEHTKITSGDVWRGAKNKSVDMVQTLLVALPILGSIGGVLGKLSSVSNFSKVFNNIDKVTNVLDKGQLFIEYGSKIETVISKDNEKEKNLLITSRLMEVSADRIGLLLAEDLQACVRTMFKVSVNYNVIKEIIDTKGFFYFLSLKNEKEEFINQEYVFRLKSLLSFYLNTDFE
ncbi:M48 family metalloprotease [Tenacibaculum salmonis]|uniref:hypothetical protein n=1 Tax=Tenacibaculum sp. P3-BQ1 TaxID=3232310 RepID=UPI0034DEB48F